MEVRYIWGEKARISTVLYYFCRYALLANIVYLLTIADLVDGNCHAGYVVSSALEVFGRAAVVIVWTARTFAVFGKNLWILLFFGTIGLMIVILDIIEVPKNSCNGSSVAPLVGGLLAIMMVIFEVLSATLTTFRSVQALSVSGPWWKQKKGFNYLVLEQGAIYFCLVTVLTIASLALNVTISGGFLQRLLNAYTIPLSGLTTARFLLHLRKWEAKRGGFKSSTANNEGEGEVDEVGTSADIEFYRIGESPAGSRTLNSQVASRHTSGRASPSLSFLGIDDFGEDPVHIAREMCSVSIEIGKGGIVEVPREH